MYRTQHYYFLFKMIVATTVMMMTRLDCPHISYKCNTTKICTVQPGQFSEMAGSKLLRYLSIFLAVTLVSYITESAFTPTLTSAGLTFTIPTLTTLTQTQLLYLTAGGLSMPDLPQLVLYSNHIRPWSCSWTSRTGCCLKPPC